MRCEVLLFAQLAEAVGAQRLEIEVDDGATVADALSQLASEHPMIATMRDRIAVAVNEAYAAPDTRLHNGQQLALIPPVSGG